ncbi:molybdopterin molybdotransferase MoeA [Nitratifractor sp.]
MKRLETLSFVEVLERALEAARPIVRSEIVPIGDIAGRVLARPVVARRDLPPFDNSAMDGFAFRASDRGRTLRIVRTIFAGDRPSASLGEGECYRIMTGAPVPPDADTVVPVEACETAGADRVRIPEKIQAGANLRRRGEEIARGETLLHPGKLLGPADAAMLAAQGIGAVEVYDRLRIAVLSTGSELREPWECADEEEVYNANATGIVNWLSSWGFAPTYAGALPDDREGIVEALGRLEGYDVILTTGGVSIGEADYLEEAYEAHGFERIFHGVNVKPGRPTMMGTMGSRFVMAMPGNPLTTLVNLFALALPVLYRLQGVQACHFDPVLARNAEAFPFRSDRSNLVLGRLRSGRFTAVRGNRVGSGMLSPLMEADALAIFDEGAAPPAVGETIRVIPFCALPASRTLRAVNTGEGTENG